MKQKRSLGVNESSLRCAERVVRWLNHLQSD